MRKTFLSLIALTIISFFCVQHSFAAEKQVAAIVNGEKITIDEINRTVQSLPQYQKLQLEILEDMIVKTLIYQESVKAGIKVDKAEVDKGFNDFISKYKMNEATLKKEMERLGITEEKMKNEFSKQLMVERFIKQRGESLNLTVTDEEVKAFYDERPDTFNKPERITVSHILIKCSLSANDKDVLAAQDKIKEIQAKLKKGEKFEDLAKQYSEDPSTAPQGGALKNEITKKAPLPKSFIDAAFALNTNEVSDEVKSVLGFHLIKVTGKKAAATTTFMEIKDSLKYRLLERKSAFEMKQYVDTLVEKSDINILIEKRKKP